MKVSVIVPIYNTEKYLRRCIDSILAQTYTDFELILIDDGSTDNSGKICDEYAKINSRIHVIHKQNCGVSSARNVGIDNAKGEYDSEIPLLQLIKYKVQASWQEYVRLNCGNYQIDNRYQYLLLKKIAYLYYRRKENAEPLSQTISEIAKELNLTEKSVEEYIIAFSTFKPKYNADYYAGDEDDDYYSSAVDSVDNNLDTERIYFKLYQQEKLIDALGELKKPEKLLIEYAYGICPNCLKNKEKKTLREASLLLGLTEDGAQSKLKKILEKLKRSLQD